MNELYEGQQFVGMDLHRRRSVLVRMTETGEHLETVRIVNTRGPAGRCDDPSWRVAGGGAGGHVRVVLGRRCQAKKQPAVVLTAPAPSGMNCGYARVPRTATMAFKPGESRDVVRSSVRSAV